MDSHAIEVAHWEESTPNLAKIEAHASSSAHRSFADRSAKAFRQWRWPLNDVFRDLRVRSGIKFGLGALLSLFIAEVLRLEHPNWSIFTVLSMMSVPYVGSISIMAITYLLGTIAGTLVGIWLAGDYASTPVIFLTLFFFVLAFAGYKFGRASASQVSLGYYLVGFMTIAVATFGVTDPAQIWETGINRVLESLDGAMSSLLVSSLVWPRSAHEEFVKARRSALNTMGKLFSAHMNAYIRRPMAPAEMEQIHQTFGERLTVLRNLLQAASRESTVFQARISKHKAFLASASHVFNLLLSLSKCELETSILSRIEPELDAVATAISEEFDILAGPRGRNQKLGSSRSREVFVAFEKKVNEVREHLSFSRMHLQERVTFHRGSALLRSLHDELNNIRSLILDLPLLDHPASESKPTFALLPTIDWFWIKTGVKASLAASISILLVMWINPPGASVIPLVAWQLTILRRPSVRAGGTGDLRSFQNGFLAALLLVACIFLLILVTPFLADYPMMNLTLFLMMFVFGFMTAGRTGINFWMQIWWLIIFVFVGLNPQLPVPTDTIIDNFVGFITGMTIATVLGRLIWPVLPQTVVRDNLQAVFRHISALLNGEPHREKIQNQLATLPIEALQASRQIRVAGSTLQQKERFAESIRSLENLVTRTAMLASSRHASSETMEALVRPQLEPDLELKQPHLVEHHRATAETSEAYRRLIATLKTDGYWDHCGL